MSNFKSLSELTVLFVHVAPSLHLYTPKIPCKSSCPPLVGRRNTAFAPLLILELGAARPHFWQQQDILFFITEMLIQRRNILPVASPPLLERNRLELVHSELELTSGKEKNLVFIPQSSEALASSSTQGSISEELLKGGSAFQGHQPHLWLVGNANQAPLWTAVVCI